MKKKRGDDETDDKEVWRLVTRTVKAYSSSPSPPASSRVGEGRGEGGRATRVKLAKTAPSAPPPHPRPLPPRAKTRAGEREKSVDAATSRRLKRGQLEMEGRLDLHGLTQAEAFAALSRFIDRAHAGGKRNVLVITGKSGVLRRMLPLWCEDFPQILALTPARPKDGGEGAWYVRLRKSVK